MKNLFYLCLFLLLFGCTKEETTTPKLDFNGTFEGTLTGWSQPNPFSGTASWAVTHTGNDITANITNNAQNVSLSFKYKGVITNDTIVTGGFEGVTQSRVDGFFSKDGKSLNIKTASGDAGINYFRINYSLKKK